jgi:phospholipid/cholesterol/gamma-HCH transport system substrate-binding protein
MSFENKKPFEAIVGCVVLLLCGLFFTHIVKINGTTKVEKYRDILYAKFNNIEGIKAGADVKIAGVRVGTVENIQLDPNIFQVKVKLNVLENLNIPDDSILSITSSGLFGDKFLDIKPGISDSVLTNGASFINTKSAINLDDLISKVATSLAKK